MSMMQAKTRVSKLKNLHQDLTAKRLREIREVTRKNMIKRDKNLVLNMMRRILNSLDSS